MVITYPVGLLLDDTGAVLDAPVVTIASVTDKAGEPIDTPGATVNGSGTATPISVDYDAEAKGEAWITLSVAQAGKTVTGAQATIAFYAAKDSSGILGAEADLEDLIATVGEAGAGLTGITGVSLSTEERDAIADALLDRTDGIEANLTFRETARLMVAVLAGKTTENSGTVVFKRRNGTTTALTVVHDTSGNRTTVTIGTLS